MKFGDLISNESAFGKVMTRLGIVIAANVLFCLFSLPVFTIGAAYTALYHVMLKTLRGDEVINPFVQFWRGFKDNFKQATLCWIVLLAVAAFGAFDVYWCHQLGGFLTVFQYAIYGVGLLLAIVALYLFPTMAAFRDTIPHLLRNAIYFALHKPLHLIVIFFFHAVPIALTLSDPQYLPVYGFIWVTCGYGLIVLLGATLLLRQFVQYLPAVDSSGELIEDADGEDKGQAPERSEAEILREMEELGM
ncbi:MAG: DUF624 domain-containing protein [Oscillospiraceae bacterium]|nr:DUF624 domain-containing protein [Oscillospiraceae bacterium]